MLFSSSLIKLGSLGFTFLVSVLLARILSLEDFGTYAFLISFIAVAAVLIQLGLPPLIIRFSQERQEKLGQNALFELWSWSLFTSLKFSALVVLPISFFLLHAFNVGIVTTLLVLVIILLTGLGQIRGAMLRAFGRVGAGFFPEHLLKPILLIIFVFSISLLMDLVLLQVIFLSALASFISFLYGASVLLRYPYGKGFLTHLKLNPEVRDCNDYKNKLLSFTYVSVSVVVLANLDIIILGIIQSADEVAVYKVALSLSLMISILYTIVNNACQPKFSSCRNDKAETKKIYIKVTLISAIFAAFILVFVFFFGESLIALVYGERFQSAFIPFLILSLGYTIKLFFGPALALLLMNGEESYVSRVFFFQVPFSILVTLYMVSLMAVEGAAVAHLISIVMFNMIICIKAIKLLRQRYY